MSYDLCLKPECYNCGSKDDLYGSNCKHLTLCSSCGKSMAENHGKCFQCGATLTRLIREYNVRRSPSSDKSYFIGKFAAGLPNFSKNCAENQWILQKEEINGSLREKFKNKPWLLKDETGQSQYRGHLEGGQSATYYLLMLQGKEFVAIPAGSWYNFNKAAKYEQLTIEQAEEKIKNRRKTVDGYARWMMKASSTGPTAFRHHPEVIRESPFAGGGKGRKKSDEDDVNVSDKGEENESEESERKARLGLCKKGSDDDDDDDDEGRRGCDFDDDDDNIEKGDDWEHEEIFSDDDEAVGNPDELDDLLAPEVPAPPEIKEDDEEEEGGDAEEEGILSKSGKELKKLLGRSNGLNDSEADEEDDDDYDEDEDHFSPVLAPTLKDPKEVPSDNFPATRTTEGSSRGTPTSKLAKGKRKNVDDTKPASGAASKKLKLESDVKPNIKEESSKKGRGSKITPSSSSKTGKSSVKGPVSEEEIKAVMLQREPLPTSELVAIFKARLKSSQDKKDFAGVLKRISKLRKINDQFHVVLRE